MLAERIALGPEVRMDILADIVKTLNRLNLVGKVLNTERVALAFCGVVLNNINKSKWNPKTAENEMRKLKAYLERQLPGISQTWVWKNTLSEISKIPHVPNKAPPFGPLMIESISHGLGSKATRAVFWLALLTCSRMGNLDGLFIQAVDARGVRLENQAHKTYKNVGARSLYLLYWSPEMKSAILGHLPLGKVSTEVKEELIRFFARNKLRQHSVRRTGVQVYLGARVPEARVMAITLHTDPAMLLSYTDLYEPVIDITEATGMAASLAPIIVDIQRRNLMADF